MELTLTRALLIGATVLGGLLAGGNVDREFVAMPAWRRVGAEPWAAFSRSADLGNGLVLYPLEAIGAALLTLAAAIAFWLDGDVARSAAWPLYAAVVLAILGLLLTVKAAPIMLGIRHVTDRAALQRAFEGFRFWGNFRAVCQVLCFLAQVLALSRLAGGGP
jgi:hypothetical protein